jgi:hypothetical protein
MPMELNIEEEEERVHQKEGTVQRKESLPKKTSAEGLTARTGVDSQKRSAITNTFVKAVERSGMERVLAPPKSNSEVTNGMRPRYLRYNIWDPNSESTPNTAVWTLTAEPLERPPQSALDDEPVAKTIRENPDLFKIVTPIRVDVFEAYLATHPNRNFVESVCVGLREGFWPWAVTPSPGYPTMNDESKPPPADEKRADFLRAQ